MRHRDEAGETLAEIVITIVLIGLTVAVLLAGLGTAANASAQQRGLVTADTVMRSYAEATKDAVRSCTTPNAPFTVPYTPPAGFSVANDGTICLPGTTTDAVTLSVTDSAHHTTTMTIFVRTP